MLEADVLKLGMLLSYAVCTWIYLWIAGAVWKPRRSRYLPSAIGTVVLVISIYAGMLVDNEPLSYLINLGASLIVLLSCFHIAQASAVVASVFSVFHTMCFKGILTGTVSLITGKNLLQVLSTPAWAMLIMLFIPWMKIIAILIYWNTVINERLKVFFSSDNEVQNVAYQHSTLFVFMLFYSYNYYYNMDLVWFSCAQVLISVLLLVIYAMILTYGIKVANLIQIDLRSQGRAEQIRNRLAHYQSYQDTYRQIDEFAHTFRETVVTAQYLFEKEDWARLRQVISVEWSDILNTLPQFRRFSNDDTFDAMMYDWSSVCQSLGIVFDANLFMPESLETDFVYQVLQYLYEIHMQLLEQSKNKREFKVSSKVQHNWLTLNSSGSYGGKIQTQKEMPYFSALKGVEIKSKYWRLKAYVEERHGILNFSIDEVQRRFTMVILIHY